MKTGKSLGIFYLDYCDVPFPRSKRKMIIGYTKTEFLKKIKKENIPEDYLCWLSECRTPGFLVEGNIEKVKKWISDHLSDKFGEPWKT